MESYNKSKIEIDPNLIYPIENTRTDICPFCRSQSIEMFTYKGFPIGYSKAVQDRLKGYDIKFDSYEIRNMRCRSCGKDFVIDWSSGFPIPLTDTYRTTIFFNEFLKGI